MRKHIFGILVLFLTLFIFGGCQNQEKDDKEVVKIGAILPLTGNASQVGQNAKNGLELLIKSYNSDTSANYECVLETFDSQSKPALGKMLSIKLLNSKIIPTLIYSQISGVTLNVQTETEKNEILLIGCVGSDQLINESTKYTYRGFISPKRVGNEISDYVKNVIHENNIGIYYINNTFGDSYRRHVKNSCQINNIEIAFDVPYDEGLGNYRDVIASQKYNNLAVIYLAGVGKSIGLFIKQLRENGYKGLILGDANLPNKSAMNIAQNFMQNVVYLDFDIPKHGVDIEDFNRKYAEEFNSEPDNFSYIAYDGLKIFMDFIIKNKTLSAVDISQNIDGYTTQGITGTFGIKEHEIFFPLAFKQVLIDD